MFQQPRNKSAARGFGSAHVLRVRDCAVAEFEKRARLLNPSILDKYPVSLGDSIKPNLKQHECSGDSIGLVLVALHLPRGLRSYGWDKQLVKLLKEIPPKEPATKEVIDAQAENWGVVFRDQDWTSRPRVVRSESCIGILPGYGSVYSPGQAVFEWFIIDQRVNEKQLGIVMANEMMASYSHIDFKNLK